MTSTRSHTQNVCRVILLLTFSAGLINCGGGGGGSGGGGITPPAAPTLQAPIEADGQVTLKWTDVPGAESYYLFHDTSPGVTPSTGAEEAMITSPYILTGLTNGTTYYFILYAKNFAGSSAPSDEVSATPRAATVAPDPPVLDASPSIGDGQVTLSWSAAAGATSYTLYFGTSAGVTTASSTITSNVSSPHTQTGLTNGQTYYFVLTASNSVGESGLSNEVSAVLPPPTPLASEISSASYRAAPPGTGASRGDGTQSEISSVLYKTDSSAGAPVKMTLSSSSYTMPMTVR